MAKISEIRDALRALKIGVSKKTGGHYPLRYRDMQFLLKEAEVDGYLQIKPFLQRPVETAIYHPGFFEQAVEVQGRSVNVYRLLREQNEIILENKEKTMKIEISTMSAKFILALLDSDEMPTEIRRLFIFGRIRFRHQPSIKGKGSPDFKELFSHQYNQGIRGSR